VLLSTWASLFHITMAMGDTFSSLTVIPISVFLFFAVWIPVSGPDPRRSRGGDGWRRPCRITKKAKEGVYDATVDTIVVHALQRSDASLKPRVLF
jgi:hypothetical protein